MTYRNCYRELIEKSNSPIIFNKIVEWDYVTWNLEKWCSVFPEEKFPFRCGRKSCHKEPLWESSCNTEYHTMAEFLHFCSDESATKNKFWYFDYKHIAEFFKDNIQIFEDISWSKLGFPERKADNSTLWIGSPGAHTPCHIDSYGYNLVAQVYGRKRWLLFPPSETNRLKPTRVPYEESSVYSNINFSCYRNLEGVKIDKCYVVDLGPGDVLFVPAKWWHYVENLTTAISINTWISHVIKLCEEMLTSKSSIIDVDEKIVQQENDNQWKLEEALVRYFICTVVQDLPFEEQKIILNPNEMSMESTSVILDVLKYCQNQCSVAVNTKEKTLPSDEKFPKDEHHSHVYKFIPRISCVDMKKIMKQISICDELERTEDGTSNFVECNTTDLKSLINAFCHPSIITEVKNKLLQ